MGLFTPRWKSNDENTRLKAVAKLKRQDVLLDLAENDHSSQVQRAAIQRLTDPGLLNRIIYLSPSEEKRKLGVDQITDEQELFKIAVSNPAIYEYFNSTAAHATERIENQELLYKVIMRSRYQGAAWAAIEKISDITLLNRLSQEAQISIRACALRKLGKEQEAILLLAHRGDIDSIKQLDDPAIWEDVAKNTDAKLSGRVYTQKLLFPGAVELLDVVQSLLSPFVCPEPDSVVAGYEIKEAWANELIAAATDHPEWIRPFWKEIKAEINKPRSHKLHHQAYPTHQDAPYDYYEIFGLGWDFPANPYGS